MQISQGGRWFKGSVGSAVGERYDSLLKAMSFQCTFQQHPLWKRVSGSHASSREKGCSEHMCPPVQEQQWRALPVSHGDICTHVRTVGPAIAVVTRSYCDQTLEPRAWTSTAKRWCVISFGLPGQTLQHFPSTFWGYLQGYCSGQWIFLHSCLVMLQVHNTHSTIPKARRLGCQDSPCEYVLPFDTQTTKEENSKKKYNWKRYIHRYPCMNTCLIHACLFKALSLYRIC